MYFDGSNTWHGYAGGLDNTPIVPVVTVTVDMERKDGCFHDAVVHCRLLGKGIVWDADKMVPDKKRSRSKWPQVQTQTKWSQVNIAA